MDVKQHETEKETMEEMDKVPLVVAISNRFCSGIKISKTSFRRPMAISVYPQFAKDSLEKVFGAFFVVSFILNHTHPSAGLSSPGSSLGLEFDSLLISFNCCFVALKIHICLVLSY